MSNEVSQTRRMTINQLPDELLALVMKHLDPSDRLRSARTCRRWAEVLSASDLMEDTKLSAAGFEISKVSAVLGKSRRQYRHLQLHRAELYDYNYNTQFWTKVSVNLRELELIDCRWSPKVFYRILRLCSKLESLSIEGLFEPPEYPGLSMEDFAIPEGTRLEEIREALSHLKHVQLHILLNKDLLEHILGLMPNVESISFSSFETGSDLLAQLPAILKAHQRITGVDFKAMPLKDEEVIALTRVAAESLQELRLDCESLTPDGYRAIGKFTKLRSLSLEGQLYRFEDNHLREILANAPDLESLETHCCPCLSDRGFAGLFELKKISHLKFADNMISSEITSKLTCGLGNISTLRHLDLRCLDVNSTVMHSLARLTNLRYLFIESHLFDSDCVEIICKSFKKLEELHLHDAARLTDADGVKLSRLKKLESLSLKNAVRLTDRTFEEGVGSPRMKFLSISGCCLTDVGLAKIAAHHGAFKKLGFGYCKEITAVGVGTLLRNEPQLQELCLLECNIGDEVFEAIDKLCPRLHLLLIHGSRTSFSGREKFVARRPSVRIVSN